MFWPPTCNAVLTSAVGEAVNPAVVQEPHRNMALICVCRRGGEEEDYLRRSLLLFFFSAHPSPCGLKSDAPPFADFGKT